MFLLPRFLLLLITAAVYSVSAQTPRTHRLEVTPDTVSYGYSRSSSTGRSTASA